MVGAGTTKQVTKQYCIKARVDILWVMAGFTQRKTWMRSHSVTVCEGATGETEQIREVEGLAQLEVDTGRWRMCIHGQPTNRTTSPLKIDTFQSIAVLG